MFILVEKSLKSMQRVFRKFMEDTYYEKESALTSFFYTKKEQSFNSIFQ